MPSDLTGTPTSLGIGTYNTSVDAPSGLGFNEAMSEIDALIAARVAAPAGLAAGEVPVWNGAAFVRSSVTKIGASSLPTLGGAELSYNETTVQTSITATTEPTANTIVTASTLSFDGATAALIEFFAPVVETGTTLGDGVVFVLYEDGASIGFFGQVNTPAAAIMRVPVRLSRRRTPAAGNRAYSVRAFKQGTGAGNVIGGTGGAAAYPPAYVRISKV